MVTAKELRLFEEAPLDQYTQTESFVVGKLDRVTKLVVHEGTITTAPIRGLRFGNVREMRVYGDHEARFPREGVRFSKDGERPIESTSMEEHPQKLIISGKVKPSYRVRDMRINFGNGFHSTEGGMVSSTLHILDPTSFSIWAEYISNEEAALLKAMGIEIPRRGSYLDLGLGLGAGLGVSALASAITYAVSAAVALGPGIIYSLSPNVTLKFPNGHVDKDTGAQVVRFTGRVYTPKSPSEEPRIETYHQGDESLRLPPAFKVRGDISVEGGGRFMLPHGMQHVYGGRFSGGLDYNRGQATLVARA